MKSHLVPQTQTSDHIGRFPIQLEILPDSNLTERDIASIAAYATWTRDPNTAEAFEGGRSIVIAAEQERHVGGICLSALQISGIGFRQFDTSMGYVTINKQFQPPSQRNFLENLSPYQGGYCYAEREALKTIRSKYTPSGTYRPEELETKVRNTIDAFAQLTAPVVPPVEAYGWYSDGPVPDSGFMVTRIPHASKERLYCEMITEPADGQTGEWLYGQCMEYMTRLIASIKKMHQQKIAHLAPHLSNWYYETAPILTDWETMRVVQKDRDGFLNRSLDFMITVKEFCDLYHALMQLPEQDIDIVRAFHLHAAQEYGKITPALLDVGIPSLRDIAQWMEQGSGRLSKQD